MAEEKEEEYVHKVYNEIAAHFSQTRYKPWPIVTSFLQRQSVGSVGIDVGCGNGKYLGVNKDVFIIGSDRSNGLIECAHTLNVNHNVLVADGMRLPHPDDRFDFGISIAVVHHWSTRDRRIAAIQHILSKIRPGGEALIYCWALEQATSRRGYQEGMDQDVLVPWVLAQKQTKPNNVTKKKAFERPERPDLENVPPKDRAQFLAEWKQKQEEKRELKANEASEQARDSLNHAPQEPETVKYRFYHLYQEGELEEDCTSAGGIVKESGYERDNWYVVVSKP
ncbi:LAMI_0D11914g1_1 [Lachancea mirantina]|uniref:LAMI_0D11914g1_1 n=1 Tax=Lachancea mirantina TaxID=1230905 RepID=A0A1G4JF88_9SACH|nr:LAMI_0D11914g1_1 [Lachancea mirantina]